MGRLELNGDAYLRLLLAISGRFSAGPATCVRRRSHAWRCRAAAARLQFPQTRFGCRDCWRHVEATTVQN